MVNPWPQQNEARMDREVRYRRITVEFLILQAIVNAVLVVSPVVPGRADEAEGREGTRDSIGRSAKNKVEFPEWRFEYLRLS